MLKSVEVLPGEPDFVRVFSGAGNDNIGSWGDVVTKTGRVKGHVRDYVYCGPGYDTVYADRLDYVAGDCGKVFRLGKSGDSQRTR